MSNFEYIINENNQIINPHGEIINNPAVMFDYKTGTLHAHGEEQNVNARYAIFKKKDTTGLIINSIACFQWNLKYANPADIVKELNKFVNNSGYARLFYNREIACDF